MNYGYRPPHHQPPPHGNPHGWGNSPWQVSSPPPVDPLASRSKRRPRWWLFTVPVAIGFMIYFLSGVEASFDFADIIDNLGIDNDGRFARLVVFAVGAIGLVLILRVVLRKKQ